MALGGRAEVPVAFVRVDDGGGDGGKGTASVRGDDAAEDARREPGVVHLEAEVGHERLRGVAAEEETPRRGRRRAAAAVGRRVLGRAVVHLPEERLGGAREVGAGDAHKRDVARGGHFQLLGERADEMREGLDLGAVEPEEQERAGGGWSVAGVGGSSAVRFGGGPTNGSSPKS